LRFLGGVWYLLTVCSLGTRHYLSPYQRIKVRDSHSCNEQLPTRGPTEISNRAVSAAHVGERGPRLVRAGRSAQDARPPGVRRRHRDTLTQERDGGKSGAGGADIVDYIESHSGIALIGHSEGTPNIARDAHKDPPGNEWRGGPGSGGPVYRPLDSASVSHAQGKPCALSSHVSFWEGVR